MFKMKLGDFVVARMVAENFTRQGVFMKKDPDGTIIIEGASGDRYRCIAKGALIIPNGNIIPVSSGKVRATREKLEWAKGLFY